MTRSRARIAPALLATLPRLDALGLDPMSYACRHHGDGLIEADVTVQTCWDADRLALARVGIEREAALLCTQPAVTRDFMKAAMRRSLEQGVAKE